METDRGARIVVNTEVGLSSEVEIPAQYEVPHEAHDDLTLVHATRRGDVSAFEKLVRKYDRKLLRIAQNIMHNREDAEDAVQEAFFKAYKKLGQFQESAKFSTWLIRIVLNESLMKLRKRRTVREDSLHGYSQNESEIVPKELADWTIGPQELYGAAELRKILIKCLLELQPALRVVFVLRDMEELSISETSEALSLSAVAVKARLFRARLHLREGLSRYLRERDGLKGSKVAAATPKTQARKCRREFGLKADWGGAM